MPKCKNCKAKLEKTEGVMVGLHRVCNFDCGAALGIKKVKEEKAKKQREQDAAKRLDLKTVRALMADVAKDAQFYARMRDLGKPCISCGNEKLNKYGGTIDGGHYRSKGSAPNLSLYTLNIHGQCSHCNRFEGGNSDYRINLVKKIGLAKVEEIERDNRPRNYTKEDLLRLKKIFRKKGNRLKKRRK